MKHSIHVNQKQALDLGMTNINQAHIFDLLTGVSTWAKPEVINEEVYYWVSRQRICTELPLLDMKPDTVYRHLKKLSDCGLIEYLKHGKKDCIRLTEKGRSYYVGNKSESEQPAMSDSNPDGYVGNESELDQNSEMNPSKLGNESEKNSDLNPTDQTTNNILQPEDQKKSASDSEIAARRVANYLHQRLLEELPEAESLNSEKWVTEIERAIRIDGRSESDLVAIIDWMHTGDKFWVSNIQSGKKLRDKYLVMAGQMRRPKTHQKSTRRPGEFPSDRIINGEVL